MHNTSAAVDQNYWFGTGLMNAKHEKLFPSEPYATRQSSEWAKHEMISSFFISAQTETHSLIYLLWLIINFMPS